MKDCQPRKVTEISETALGLSRRNLLKVIAVGFAAVGLSASAESALAAAKTYKICKTTDIKVGSARMFSVGGRAIVVTQPKKGTFKAFNGVCTHQGAALAKTNSSVRTVKTSMVCPEHGAAFDTTTGAVTRGPASAPLTKVTARVSGTQVSVSF